jgi:aspartate kinase
MLVMKFGGTSVGTAKTIDTVFTLVQKALPRRPVVVVSAHSGVTDMLFDLAQRATRGSTDTAHVVSRHEEILQELGLPLDLHAALLQEMKDLVVGMKLVGEASPRAVDYLVSFGERLSARTVAAYLTKRGLAARAVDAFEAGLRTDSTFGRAKPVADDGRIKRWLAGIQEVPVVTGYIAMDEAGNITTLGRNGSDYSASLFGNALDAEEIQIWTDVDGVMTADPKLVPNPRPIPTMSFDEAAELAYYGGKVLHPATITPAMEKSIPVRVLNTKRPESKGTVILPSFEEPGVSVRSIVHKKGIYLITLVSARMLQQHGFLAKVFGAAATHEVVVDLIATSEVSISMTTDSSKNIERFVAELALLGEAKVEPHQAMVCVIGHGITTASDVAAKVFTTLAEAGVRVRVISQGAIKVNIALLVAEQDMQRAVVALHQRFFG